MSAGGVRNEPTSVALTGNSPLTSQAQEPVMGPPVDRSMGFGRQFQQPSFINPFMGAYGFGQPFGGFNNPYGGFGGGFGMGIGGLYGGYNPMPFGGYQSYQPPPQQFNYELHRQQGPGNAYAQPMMGGGISPFFGGGYY